MRRSAPIFTALISLLEVACSPSAPSERPREPTEAANQERVAATGLEPEVEAPDGEGDESTVYQQLLDAGLVAVFAGKEGVVAYSASGSFTEIIDEPFYSLIIDYDTGLMWLDRSWSDTHPPGLYVVDLMSPEVHLTKVTRLTRGVEIIGVDGRPLPMTEGITPYHVHLNANPVLITLTHANEQCGDECNPSADAVALMSAATSRRADSLGGYPRIRRLDPPSERLQNLRTGYSVPLDQLSVSLRLVKGVGHGGANISWQLYDNVSGEYVSPKMSSRSKHPLPEGNHVQHLMLCEGGDTLVVERGLFTRDFVRLDQKRTGAFGVCLRGGVLFEDRTGFRFVDPYP